MRQLLSLPRMDGGVLGFFLPGVATRLGELATSDEKAPTPLLVQLMSALEALLLGCLGDAGNAAALAAAASGMRA